MSEGDAGDGLSRLVDLFESRLIPALERIAAALEDAPRASGNPASGSMSRSAVHASVEFLRRQWQAAREIGDADRILELHDTLSARISQEEREGLDREVVGDLMVLIQKRLRVTPISPDLPLLAASVAERFAGTAEGASLRRALPTLRRSVGLCPRCARPYRGIADACPECLVEQARLTPQVLLMTRDDDSTETAAPPTEEVEPGESAESPFVDPTVDASVDSA